MRGYKYKTKYSELPAEEIIRIKKEIYQEWKNKLSEEKQAALKKRMMELNKNQDKSGECRVCGGRIYKDVYQHKKSKMHMKNERELNKKIIL